MAQHNQTWQRTVLLATDRSQSIIGEIVDGQAKTIAYSAYGEQFAQQKVETRLGFNGQLREADIGWYLLGNGYRAYNPRLMRFHSPDSWSPFRGGGLNAYMYCVGDPVNRVDPTGHFWDVIKLFVRENIRYRTPQKLAIANVKANARYKAMSTLGRSSRPDTPSPPSRQDTAWSQIGGFIMGAPGPRNRVPSPGGDLAPQNVGGWEPQTGGTPWRVSRTAQDGPSSSTSRQVVSSGGRPDNPSGRPMKEENYLQGGEVLPRKDHWPSNESISSNASSGTNASNTTTGNSIHSDQYSHAASLRDLEESWNRLNQLERGRDWSSSESFHSAVSSIRNS
ncbi:RHS repeat-associated core domain-containing protein [Pseudomonas grandcourensis]|uniref:RHS repeat-associated core domain-containing protein n=1 Tax=Pseudomonas grandcourensis TaxID=3136736 RepID=UPI00326474EE